MVFFKYCSTDIHSEDPGSILFIEHGCAVVLSGCFMIGCFVPINLIIGTYACFANFVLVGFIVVAGVVTLSTILMSLRLGFCLVNFETNCVIFFNNDTSKRFIKVSKISLNVLNNDKTLYPTEH